MKGRSQRNGGKSDRRGKKERNCVDLVATLTVSPSPSSPFPLSSYLTASLSSHPLFLALPTSSPGNKDFHSCARGDPQQGREGRRGREIERETKLEKVVKVGRFDDHSDQARCPGIACCCFCAVHSDRRRQPWWHPPLLS